MRVPFENAHIKENHIIAVREEMLLSDPRACWYIQRPHATVRKAVLVSTSH